MEESPQEILGLDEFAEDLGAEDDLGAVIRAHIRIENLLYELLERMSPNPVALKSLNLNYDREVRLAVLLGMDSSLAPPLKLLGKLRNKFAHRIDAAITSEFVEI